MPLPAALIGTIISSGSSLVGTAANAFLQDRNNRKMQLWNEKMYGWQRRDALADWQMQAAYNSPEAQMQRLKEAGLNPNLVYGNGATATMSSGPRSASAPSWSPTAPQIDIGRAGNIMGQYYDIKEQQARLDNLSAQLALMEQERKNKEAMEFKIYADTANKTVDTAGKEIKNKYAPGMAEISLQAMAASIEKTQAETVKTQVQTGIALDANERAAIKQDMSLKEAAERILTMRKQRLLMDIEAEKKKVSTEHEREKIQQTRQNIKNMQIQYDNLNIIWERLHFMKDIDKEKARILRSTPDWSDQHSLKLLEGILGGAFSPGSVLNPRMSRGWSSAQ